MSPRRHQDRQSPRLPMAAGVRLGTGWKTSHEATISNISPEGCCVTHHYTLLQSGDRVMLRLDGLESIECTVRWVRNRQAGLEFARRLYGPVVEHLRARHGHRVRFGVNG